MSKLKDHAITLYEMVINYVDCVLDGMPADKMSEPILQGDKPGDILFHMVATPNWWMKQAERPFDFKARFEDFKGVISLLNTQLEAFKKLLEDPSEIVYTPRKSIPWIMIRSANHLMHHASMLVYARHIFGLGPLREGNNWGKIVDLAGDFNYS